MFLSASRWLRRDLAIRAQMVESLMNMPPFGRTWSYGISRGREVTRSLRDAVIVDLEHPGRALLVPTFSVLDDLALDQVLDQLPDDVAMGGEHGGVERSIAEELGQALEAVAFFEGWRRLDLQTARSGERFDRLHAPQVWAREDVGDSKRLENRDKILGLLFSFAAQRP